MASQDSSVAGAVYPERVEIIDNEDHIFIAMDLSSDQEETIAKAVKERLSTGLDFHVYGLEPSERTSTAKTLHPTALIIFRASNTTEAYLSENGHLIINLTQEDSSDFAYMFKDATGYLFFNTLANVVFQIRRLK